MTDPIEQIGQDLEAPRAEASRNRWVRPMVERLSADDAELTASDSGGDIVWS